MKPVMAVLVLVLGLSAQAQNIKSVQVLDSSNVATGGVLLHLKNLSTLALIGITVGRGATTEEDLALQPAQRILPQQSFEFHFPGPAEEAEIRALLFENGSGEGDPHLVRVMAARLDGAKASARAVIQALSEESNRDRLLEKLEASPGVRGAVNSVVVPSRALELLPVAQRQEIAHAYASGYLGTKERAIREVKKLQSAKEATGRQSLSTSPLETLRVYFDNVLAVGRGAQ